MAILLKTFSTIILLFAISGRICEFLPQSSDLMDYQKEKGYESVFSAPLLASPEDGSSQIHPQNVTLTWHPVDGATIYECLVSRYSEIVAPSVKVTSDTIVRINNLTPFTQYYWKVRVRDKPVEYNWSTTWTFTTATLPPVPISPINNQQNVPLKPTVFSCSGSAVTPTFQIVIATDSSFSNTKPFLASIPQYQTSKLNPKTTYFWRVRTMTYDDEFSEWSNINSFRTQIAPPQLIYPINNQNNVMLSGNTMQWNECDDALYYELYLARNPALHFAQKIVVNGISVDCPVLSPNATYYWAVKSYGEQGLFGFSEVNSFTTIELYPPLLTFPQNNDTIDCSQGINLLWTAQNNATGYEIQYDFSPDFQSPVQISTDDISFNLPTLPLDTMYFWRVRSKNGEGFSAWSLTSRFYSGNFSGITSKEKSTIFVYPNPSDGLFTIGAMDGSSVWTNIDIFKVSGSMAISIAYDNYSTNSINLCHLEKGIYILKITLIDRTHTLPIVIF